jgi:hypothetical protein
MKSDKVTASLRPVLEARRLWTLMYLHIFSIYTYVYASIQNLERKTYVENLRVGEQIKLKSMLQKEDRET